MKKYDNVIKEMKDYTEINREETFLIKHDEKQHFCNLKTLNYLINELHLKVTVLANCYCLWSQGFNKAIVKFNK